MSLQVSASLLERAEDEILALRTEVERLREHIRKGDRFIGAVERADRAEAEVERLRGLIAEAEWVSGGYIMGPPSCPWCSYPVKEEGHAPGCPAFSAQGKVR